MPITELASRGVGRAGRCPQLPAGPCQEAGIDPLQSALETPLPPKRGQGDRADPQGLLDLEGPPQEAAVVKGFFQLSF